MTNTTNHVCCHNVKNHSDTGLNISVNCDNGRSYCLDEEIKYTCRTLKPYLVWSVVSSSRTKELEMDFTRRDSVGCRESCAINGVEFSAELIGNADNQADFRATLSYRTKRILNNSNIYCLDGFTGEEQKCGVRLLRELRSINQ